jgi:hypothetical protein
MRVIRTNLRNKLQKAKKCSRNVCTPEPSPALFKGMQQNPALQNEKFTILQGCEYDSLPGEKSNNRNRLQNDQNEEKANKDLKTGTLDISIIHMDCKET